MTMTVEKHKQTAVAHHASAARTTPGKQAWQWLRQGKLHLLMLFLSDFGRDIITRKYDAFTTDRAYVNKPSGIGLVGRMVDRMVLKQDMQVALRERLDIVQAELTTALIAASERVADKVRVASGPCGLLRDLTRTWTGLEQQGRNPANWLDISGFDLDERGDVINEAQLRAASAGMPIRLVEHDLLDVDGLHGYYGHRPVHVFLSMGLTVWLDPASRLRFLRGIHDVMAPAGVAIIDNFREHDASRYLKAFEMEAWYPSDEEQESQLREAGFEIDNKRESSNGVSVVYVVRKPHRTH